MSVERLMALKYKFEYDTKLKELESKYMNMLKEKDSKISDLESQNKRLVEQKFNNTENEKDIKIKELMQLKDINSLRIKSLEDKLAEKNINCEYVYLILNQEHISSMLKKFRNSLKDILLLNVEPINHLFIKKESETEEIYNLRIKNHHINNHLHKMEKKYNAIRKKIQDLILTVEHFENYNIKSLNES